MPNQANKDSTGSRTIAWLLVEMIIYAVFVYVYYQLVLHFLSGWLKELFDAHESLYAVVALGLIIAQAALLESVTTGLFRLIRGKSK